MRFVHECSQHGHVEFVDTELFVHVHGPILGRVANDNLCRNGGCISSLSSSCIVVGAEKNRVVRNSWCADLAAGGERCVVVHLEHRELLPVEFKSEIVESHEIGIIAVLGKVHGFSEREKDGGEIRVEHGADVVLGVSSSKRGSVCGRIAHGLEELEWERDVEIGLREQIVTQTETLVDELHLLVHKLHGVCDSGHGSVRVSFGSEKVAQGANGRLSERDLDIDGLVQ